MDKQTFLNHVEHAYDTKKLQPENLFLFKLLDVHFSYDEVQRTCTITCPVTEIMLNSGGIIHGGLLMYLADTAMGHLIIKMKGTPFVTLDLNTSFLKAEKSGKLICTANFVKEGNSVAFVECHITNEAGDVLSVSQATFYRSGISKK